MPYDVALRHQQALDPSALTTITAALHALTSALDDCRNAGVPFAADAGVLLLARHLGHLAGAGTDDTILRRRCAEAIAELERFPALLTLAIRGVGYDAAAKDLFHADGRKAMHRLAAALGLAQDRYRVHSNRSHISQSGEITLHGEEVLVQLSLGPLGPDNEVIYRKVDGRCDTIGDVRRFASVRDLLAPERFAERLRRELRLTPPAREPQRLAG
ncbi:hypothetical protein J2Y58_003997 [Sphingomonas sp. BE138]|uniref:hypothetical protein n=1 Tax=Sphingomonas sp. BE138 TaxID=2817845 RepID=UPI0028643E18|nr:hypothetical protein [Sphingomonas sp. BE138]MDR6790614.1 hypothetical protein [Sphingomonas sp. BE138]